MSYITYLDDPTAQRVNNSYTSLCSGNPSKKYLKLVDKCLVIFNQGKSEASYCALENLLYPVDSQQLIDFEICAGETLLIFDNQLDNIPPTQIGTTTINYPLGGFDSEYFEALGTTGFEYYYVLANDRNYARGVVLYPMYPQSDKNGASINPANKSCEIVMTDRALNSITLPLSEVFSHFSNPETQNANKLINKIEIHNPNLNFSIKVKGLVVYVKSNSDPNDCAC